MPQSEHSESQYLDKHHITIRPYEPAEKARIIQLLNSPSIKPDIWEWQFERPDCQHRARPIVALDKWGNVMGFNGMMPVQVHVADHGELDAAWSCDFFVSGEARGKGVGKNIKQALKPQSPITFALGTSATAARVLQQSDWAPYSDVFSYRLSQPNRTPPASDLAFTGSLPPPAQLDTLWARIRNDYNAAVVRDAAYLQWRYAHAPLARYQYVAQYRDDTLYSLAVIFIGANYVSLVDYVGPRASTDDKVALLDLLLGLDKTLRCTTSCPVWRALFQDYNFERTATPVNCFIYAADDAIREAIVEGFYLMPGDCDGDILASSVESASELDRTNPENLSVSVVDESNWHTLQAEWDPMLARSDNNTLFLTWTWIKCWWQTFAQPHRFRLVLLACRRGERLVGVAPMYIRTYRRYGIAIRQLQLIGCSWSGPNTFRSEYLDFIVDRDFHRAARAALLRHIFDHVDWDELVLGDIPHESLTTRLLDENYAGKHLYLRHGHRDYSVRVPVGLSEKDYTEKLSGNLRRNAFNMYRRLESESRCQSTVYTSFHQCLFNIIGTLNKLHLPRWGKPCFLGLSRRFHGNIIEQFSTSNQLLVMAIEVNQRPISIAYNLVHDGSVYNIQLGFSISRDWSSYSLGLLQLGQCILYSISREDITCFDMLAGFGKQEYYKSRFGGQHYHIETRQYLRRPWLIYLYKLYDYKALGLLKKLIRPKKWMRLLERIRPQAGG